MSTTADKATQRGKLIALAGIDGAGKSTLAAALHQALTSAGHEAILAGKDTVEISADEDLSHTLTLSMRSSIGARQASARPAVTTIGSSPSPPGTASRTGTSFSRH